jgi:hypothetical protein
MIQNTPPGLRKCVIGILHHCTAAYYVSTCRTDRVKRLHCKRCGDYLDTSEAIRSNRDTVLLSHANPEDNEFALWLALQLANEGYKVWCDLTKLLGGEVFWDDIEEVIRKGAVKVLYVLSRASNAKDGPLRELHLAKSIARNERLKDFVIPLHVDDLPYGETTIELTRVYAVPFERSWAAGLTQLLEKLETAGVPKTPSFNRASVNQWWRTQFSAEQGVRHQPEEYLSNWFPVSIPANVYFHALDRRGIGKLEVPSGLPYPAIQDGSSLITFAPGTDFEGKLGPDVYIARESDPKNVEELLAETEFGKHLFWLLRLAWEHMITERGLPVYEFANKVKTFYFPKDLIPSDRVYFPGVDGNTTYRAMAGYSSRKNLTTGERVKRFWHFAVEARPMVHPILAFVIKPHVLFSSDGTVLWTSKKRMAAARRSECKDWWNDEWRDRTLAAMKYLSAASGLVEMKLGSAVHLSVQASPISFQSPVAYTDPQELRGLTAEPDRPDDYGHDLDTDDDPFEDDPVTDGE